LAAQGTVPHIATWRLASICGRSGNLRLQRPIKNGKKNGLTSTWAILAQVGVVPLRGYQETQTKQEEQMPNKPKKMVIASGPDWSERAVFDICDIYKDRCGIKDNVCYTYGRRYRRCTSKPGLCVPLSQLVENFHDTCQEMGHPGINWQPNQSRVVGNVGENYSNIDFDALREDTIDSFDFGLLSSTILFQIEEKRNA
jgi:hypothetical protein